MEQFVARENIRRFKERLVNCSDERQRATLNELLAAEEKKLKELENNGSARSQQPAHEIEQGQTALRKGIFQNERLENSTDEMLARHHRERVKDDTRVGVTQR